MMQINLNGGVGAAIVTGGSLEVDRSTFDGNAGDGLTVVAASDARVECSEFTGNGGYGINATLPGQLKLKDNIFAGNALGDFNVAGGGSVFYASGFCEPQEKEPQPLPTPPPLPWNVIHPNSGASQTLECTQHGGTVLILPSSDHVAIPCPIGGEATLTSVASDRLPNELGDNYTYVSGRDVQVRPPPESGFMQIDFLMPPSGSASNFMILHWDGSNWVDRGGIETQDNFLEITSREVGVYLLVSQ
jgi:hypothetical protein